MSIELKGMKSSREIQGASVSGYPMLVVLVALAALLAWDLAGNFPGEAARQGDKWLFVALMLAPVFARSILPAMSCGACRTARRRRSMSTITSSS